MTGRGTASQSKVRRSIKCSLEHFREVFLLDRFPIPTANNRKWKWVGETDYLPPFQPFTSSYIAAPLETPDGSIQLTRNRRRSMVGIHIIASLVVGEPRHKHKGLFVSGLPILEASHCYLTVCGRGGGQARTGAAMSSKPGLSQAAHHCIGTPAPQRLLTKNEREVKIEESRRH